MGDIYHHEKRYLHIDKDIFYLVLKSILIIVFMIQSLYLVSIKFPIPKGFFEVSFGVIYLISSCIMGFYFVLYKFYKEYY